MASNRRRHSTDDRDGEGASGGSTLFWGISTLYMSQWMLIDEARATRLKRGEDLPTPQELRLFKLYRDGRILDQENWPPGWQARGSQLIDPEGNSTTQGALRAYFVIYQLARELMRKLDGADADAAKARWEKAMELAG